MRRFFILAGYCQLSMSLYLSGKLEHYINTRYSYLAFLSMGIAFVLAVVQLIIWVKQTESSRQKRLGWGSLLTLGFPIAVGFLVPTVNLDARAVASKGYYFPLAAGVDDSLESADGTDIQYLQPDTSLYFTSGHYQQQMARSLARYKDLDEITISSDNYMEVMEIIYRYPEQFLGKTIRYTGFVYRDPEQEDQFFLFRFGIIHCIADSGVYGLLTNGAEISYDDNTWVQVTGTLTKTYHQSLGQHLPTLVISDSSAISPPKNPYVYRTFY